jgi:hypothetical protein
MDTGVGLRCRIANAEDLYELETLREKIAYVTCPHKPTLQTSYRSCCGVAATVREKYRQPHRALPEMFAAPKAGHAVYHLIRAYQRPSRILHYV